MQERHEVTRILRERGLWVTQQRIAVLEYLLGAPGHPSAEEVGAAVNRTDATTSRASVYNVLRSLTRAGIVSELVLDDAVARYDANLEPHHHFVCTSCGKVDDVPAPLCPTLPPRSLPDGRLVTGVSVTLRGVCAGCAPAH